MTRLRAPGFPQSRAVRLRFFLTKQETQHVEPRKVIIVEGILVLAEPESVVEQYLTTVRPTHEEFVEPSKRHADLIISEGGEKSGGD